MGSESIALAHEDEPWPNGLLTQRPLREEQQLYSFSEIQLVDQKFRDKTTLASKTRFSRHCLVFKAGAYRY